MIKAAPRYTAVQMILLAADDLMAQGASEFSEWDLTIAAWNRDRARFGLRGYTLAHPDHKRVMMEIMGKKPHNPLLQGLMQKVVPNTYRLTPYGRAEAARLRGGPPTTVRKRDAAAVSAGPLDHHDAVRPFAEHAVFLGWREDPDEPRRFADAAMFLGADPKDRAAVAERFRAVGKIFKGALSWCNKNDVAYLTKGPNSPYPPIRHQDLADLLDFLQALSYRFPQLGEPS